MQEVDKKSTQQAQNDRDSANSDRIPKSDRKHHKFYQLVFMAVFILVLLNVAINPTSAYLEQRSVTVSSALPNATNVSNTFVFDILGTPTVGSIVFEYCSNTPLFGLPCVAPTGLDTSMATLSSQLGEIGFTIHPSTTANSIVVTRAAGPATPGQKSYQFGSITNPDGTSSTIFVRIALYATTDGTGPAGDVGSVTFSIQNPLTVTLYVPPYLALCSGVTVAPDCTSTTGSTVDLGELSKVSPTSGTTQFAVATNSVNGYTATIEGSTMTAGNRVIAALPVQSVSQGGVSQFGINLRANTIPSVGQNISGGGTGSVAAQYNTPNQFKFVSGDVIATSSLPTDWNRYTISYMVNVADGQPAGRYATTMTVIATTTF